LGANIANSYAVVLLPPGAPILAPHGIGFGFAELPALY